MLDIDIIRNILLGVIVNTTLIFKGTSKKACI